MSIIVYFAMNISERGLNWGVWYYKYNMTWILNFNRYCDLVIEVGDKSRKHIPSRDKQSKVSKWYLFKNKCLLLRARFRYLDEVFSWNLTTAFMRITHLFYSESNLANDANYGIVQLALYRNESPVSQLSLAMTRQSSAEADTSHPR